VVLNSNTLFGNKMGFINTTNQDYANLDTMEDWKDAEEILKKRS